MAVQWNPTVLTNSAAPGLIMFTRPNNPGGSPVTATTFSISAPTLNGWTLTVRLYRGTTLVGTHNASPVVQGPPPSGGWDTTGAPILNVDQTQCDTLYLFASCNGNPAAPVVGTIQSSPNQLSAQFKDAATGDVMTIPVNVVQSGQTTYVYATFNPWCIPTQSVFLFAATNGDYFTIPAPAAAGWTFGVNVIAGALTGSNVQATQYTAGQGGWSVGDDPKQLTLGYTQSQFGQFWATFQEGAPAQITNISQNGSTLSVTFSTFNHDLGSVAVTVNIEMGSGGR